MAPPTMEEFAALKTKVEAAEGKFQDVTARIDTQQQMFELLKERADKWELAATAIEEKREEEVTKLGILWSKNGTMDIANPNKRSYNSAIKKVQTTRDKIKTAVTDGIDQPNPIIGFKKSLRNPFPCSYCPIEHKRICWKEQYDVDLE